MEEFTFLADSNNLINLRSTELHEYKVYLIVRLGLQKEAQLRFTIATLSHFETDLKVL